MNTYNLIGHIPAGGIRLLAGIAALTALTLASVPASATLVEPQYGSQTLTITRTGRIAKPPPTVRPDATIDTAQILQAAYMDMASSVSLSLVQPIADQQCSFTGSGANTCTRNVIPTVGKSTVRQSATRKIAGVQGSIPRAAQNAAYVTTRASAGLEKTAGSPTTRAATRRDATAPASVTVGTMASNTARGTQAVSGSRSPSRATPDTNLSTTKGGRSSRRASKYSVPDVAVGSVVSDNLSDTNSNLNGTNGVDWGILDAGDNLSSNSSGIASGNPAVINSVTTTLSLASNNTGYTTPGVVDPGFNTSASQFSNGFSPLASIPEPATLFLLPLAFGVMLMSIRRL